MATNEEKNPLDNLMAKYDANKKRINMIATVVVIAVVGALAYTRLYKAPRVDKAATNVAWAQRMLEVDSFNLALNGDGQHSGFLKVQKKFSGTPTANLCNHYIGVCYLHMGDFDNAVKYLKDFDGNGTMLAYASWGALGDAYMEKGDVKNGIEYYKKASGNKEDEAITPVYLYRLALAYEMNNQPEEAKNAYKTIKEKFPTAQSAQDVDRHLARLGVIN